MTRKQTDALYRDRRQWAEHISVLTVCIIFWLVYRVGLAKLLLMVCVLPATLISGLSNYRVLFLIFLLMRAVCLLVYALVLAVGAFLSYCALHKRSTDIIISGLLEKYYRADELRELIRIDKRLEKDIDALLIAWDKAGARTRLPQATPASPEARKPYVINITWGDIFKFMWRHRNAPR